MTMRYGNDHLEETIHIMQSKGFAKKSPRAKSLQTIKIYLWTKLSLDGYGTSDLTR